jgi:cytochrome b pre-mRNA-processing protein 3
MISLPFGRSRRSANIDALYGAIVAQARLPVFYRDYGVPDTVSGRLDMITLHLALVLRQFAKASGGLQPPGQELFDRFCQDIDDNFREMGVGDLTVPKKMQHVAGAFYGSSKAYDDALDAGDAEALAAAVARNVFATRDTAPDGAKRLAVYMQEAGARFAAQEPAALGRAELAFPDPETISIP